MTKVLWVGAIILWATAVWAEAPWWAYAVIGLVWGAGCSFIANWDEYEEMGNGD